MGRRFEQDGSWLVAVCMVISVMGGRRFAARVNHDLDTEGVITLGDARSFYRLTSRIPPLDSMRNFDADVKASTTGHQCENPLKHDVMSHVFSSSC